MGWLWGAKAPAKPSQNAELESAQPPPPPPPSQQPAAPAAPETDPEMRKFLEELMGEVKNMRDADQAAKASAATPPPPPSTKKPISPWGSRWASSSYADQETPSSSSSTSYADTTTTTTTDSSFSTTTTDPDNPNNEPRLSPLAESLLPTTMDCEGAFNLAFYCRSLGGQFNNLYRYGTVRSCNEHWKDFTFCMRVKGFGEGKVKEDAIRDHYRKKELEKYGPGKPSSEDVWKERKELVKPGVAFVMPVEAPEVGDAEYQKWEMERMERIRKELKEKEAS